MRGRAALFIGLAAVLAQEEPQPPPLWRKAQARSALGSQAGRAMVSTTLPLRPRGVAWE